jgi:predicted dinucleotide-binding enzyme
MKIAIIGTGFIGGIIGGALARSGNEVTFGAREPESAVDVATATGAAVAAIPDAISSAEVVILAIPGSAVESVASESGDALASKLVIDATNKMGAEVSNSRAALPAGVRYARAFNTLGGENMADPEFAGGRADMFFSAPEADRATVEAVIEGVGLRPVFVGEDEEELVDSLFKLWIALAVKQGRGRRLAFRLLER